jgi:hypothetical protein
MSKSRADFIFQVLDNLGILVPGQAPSDTNIAKVDRIVDASLAKLSGLGIYYVDDAGELGPSGGAIDDAAFLPAAVYVASDAAPSFNLPAEPKFKMLVSEAEDVLRTLGRPTSTRRTLKIDAGIPMRQRYAWPLK